MFISESEKKLFIEFEEEPQYNCYLSKTDDNLYYYPSQCDYLFKIINIIWLNETDIYLKYENEKLGIRIVKLEYIKELREYKINNKSFVNGVKVKDCDFYCKSKINFDLIDINNEKVVKLF